MPAGDAFRPCHFPIHQLPPCIHGATLIDTVHPRDPTHRSELHARGGVALRRFESRDVDWVIPNVLAGDWLKRRGAAPAGIVARLPALWASATTSDHLPWLSPPPHQPTTRPRISARPELAVFTVGLRLARFEGPRAAPTAARRREAVGDIRPATGYASRRSEEAIAVPGDARTPTRPRLLQEPRASRRIPLVRDRCGGIAGTTT